MKNDKKLIKKMKKTRDIHHFWLFPKRPEFVNVLSIFYRYFFSPRKQRKMNKNYQKMMKNDKILIKKWKKLETLIIFSFFEPSQGGVWGWGEVCQAGDVCQGSVRGCQGRSAGEICQGRSARECQGRSARGELPGREARGGQGVCQGRSARAS